MIGHLYATPATFDRALKKAAKTAGGDPGEAYRQALRDRFLCRVFYGGNGRFVLKGGSGMLARIPNARATRDLDFAASGRVSAESALAELERVAALDLGDWCSFKLTKSEESMDENGYSRLLRLRFATLVGREEKDPVLIDLSLDCQTTLPPERLAPANRLEMPGLETCDYLMYPLPDQMADKLCAIMELQPGGYPSSRMKDLVDVVLYATNEQFDLGQLRCAIASECAKCGMSVPGSFAAPGAWRDRFEDYAQKNGVQGEFVSFETASALASRFFNPALVNAGRGNDVWDSKELCWAHC